MVLIKNIGQAFLKRSKAVGERARRQNIIVLKQIWHDQYPPDDPKEHTLLEKILLVFPLLGRTISASNLVAFFTPGGKSAYMYIDLYVLGWLALLIISLAGLKISLVLAAFLACYRIIDIVTYQLCIILVDSQRSDWRLASLRRSFLSAMINLVEIIIAFAILYLVSNGIIENKEYGAIIMDATTAVYFSFVTMTTLGYGELIPNGPGSRMIVVAQIGTEILFLLCVVPAFVSNMVTQLGGREFKTPSKRE
jgi:hypothetical protein